MRALHLDISRQLEKIRIRLNTDGEESLPLR